MQISTRMSSIATLYGIQIMEEIDRINYEEVEKMDTALTNAEEAKKVFYDSCKEKFKIPSAVELQILVAPAEDPDNTGNTIKKVTLVVNMNQGNRVERIALEKIKVKEL